MKKKNAWSSVKFGSFTVKYSKSNKTWQIWRKRNLITDYDLKSTAVNYAKRKSALED